MRHRCLISLLALALCACSQDEELLAGIPNLAGGNPLVPEVALYPFPSEFYLVQDASSLTGRQLALPDEAMPGGLSPDNLLQADGFSRLPAILAFFEGGLDPESLPDIDDPSAAMASDPPVLLLREESWEAQPLLAELDLTAEDADEQALILRPQDLLEADTGYVVVLTDGLRAADGGTPPLNEAFRALRDGIPTDSPAVEAQRQDFELVNQAIAGAGLDPERVLLAWSFHTRSEEQVLAPLLALQDAAMEWSLDDWSIESDAWDDELENRLIQGSFTAPDFLGDEQLIELDSAGAALQRGTREVPFMLTIPASAADELRPVVVFGHGFFSAMEEPTWSSLNNGLQTWRMAAATTEFIGFNEDDMLDTMGLIAEVMDGVPVVVAQQMQSHAHFTLLGRLVQEELAEVVLSEGGQSILDGEQVHYMGISNGGTQGLTIMTASPFFRRGVLVVPGAGWTHMLQRAVQWNSMGTVFANQFEDPRDLQLVMSLLQPLFDPIDALNWVEHLAQDRLEGRPAVEVTLHEAVGDCQVANMVTEWVARAGDIPLVTPSPRDVWGLETIAAEPPDGAATNAALFIYDEGYDPLPSGNIPPEEDNEAHDSLRKLSSYLEQVGAFLEDGNVVQVCDGACDPD